MILVFYKTNADGTLYFYSIHDRQAHLFSEHAFIVLHGVNYRGGRQKIYTFDSRQELEQKLRKIFNDRIKKGYTLLYSYPETSMYKYIYEEQKQMQA